MRTLQLFSAILIVLLLWAEPAVAQFGGSGGPAAGPPGLPGRGQQAQDSRQRVDVTVAIDRTEVEPGGEAVLAVIFDMDEGWKIWAGDRDLRPYISTTIHIETPDDRGVTIHRGYTQWPEEKKIDFLGEELPVYEGRVVAYIPVTVADDAETGPVILKVRPVYQACDDRICLGPTPQPPSRADEEPSRNWQQYGYEITLDITENPQPASADEAIFGNFDTAVWEPIRAGIAPPQYISFGFFEINIAGAVGIFLLLLIAAIGGFLLNLTPCVLPVIPIKIMSLSAQAANRAKCFSLGIAMALGIVALWLSIGAAVAGFGAITSTNELFQYPAFPITVGLIIIVMAVAMCGLFSVRLPQWVYTINPSHDSYHGSFGFGIMTGILALPCTAPFMGAAIAAATLFSPLMALTVFAAIGAGQAAPYIVLAAYPKLADRLPKAGPASELVKQVMGLLMVAAGAFFLGIGLSGMMVTPPDPPSRAYWWVVAAFVAVAGLWLLLRTVRITPRTGPRIAFGTIGLLLAVGAIFAAVHLTDRGPIPWEYYTAERLEEALNRGDVVVIEFTAEWCLNCKYLERTVLFTQPVIEAMTRNGVTPIKVDLTGNNPMGNLLLNQLGWRSIPLLVVLDPASSDPVSEPVFAYDWYSTRDVLDAIERAAAQRVTRDEAPASDSSL